MAQKVSSTSRATLPSSEDESPGGLDGLPGRLFRFESNNPHVPSIRSSCSRIMVRGTFISGYLPKNNSFTKGFHRHFRFPAENTKRICSTRVAAAVFPYVDSLEEPPCDYPRGKRTDNQVFFTVAERGNRGQPTCLNTVHELRFADDNVVYFKIPRKSPWKQPAPNRATVKR